MIQKNAIPEILLKKGKKRFFQKNENIYKTDVQITSCYLILSGIAKIYIDHNNGRRSILDFAGSNDWLGELSIFCAETDIKENKVLQEIECLEFKLLELQKICKEDAAVSFYFASYISRKLLARSYRMSESLNYSVDIKLASFILQYQHNGRYEISHTDVSEYLNVSYRHILYVIRQFCDNGILRKDGGKGYVIADRDKLKLMQNAISEHFL